MYHFTEERPWGGFENLLEAEAYKVKRLVIKPGQRISYQSHQKRAEHWYIVSVATIDDTEIPVGPGSTVDVGVGVKHRVGCTGEEDLILIEVQTGTYFEEDDIERFSDDYNRVS